jgi:chemotaxis protein CheD
MVATMGEMIKVGMADLKTGKNPDIITTLGLGSCIGIALYDSTKKIGGLAHIMLPDSTTIRNSSQNIAKFADTGIDELVRQMEKLGARKARMVAKIAGGATMFTFQGRNDMMQVGERNVQAVKKKLKEINIPILAEDTGKNYGRTVTFYPETGEFYIRAVGRDESVI